MTKDFHKMVGYQIYPKSFKDTNGDGLGDISGIIEKLPYLKSLGVDFIWINPIYKSPQIDGGYDISDFYAIDESFGTLDDFKALLSAAHKLGLKIMLDLVVNHTSDQHPWFIEAQKSRDNRYRDYYLWADATADEMPNNWKSFFGGSTWTYQEKTGQAYFHVFAPQQPDLNWKNPALRAEIYKMIRFWLELGIDGFRLDAISHIQKAPWDFEITSWEDNGPWQPFMNVAGIETYLHELKEIFDEYGALTVGEASGVLSTEASAWTATDGTGYVDMIFELEHNPRGKNAKEPVKYYKETLMRWQNDLLARGWNALYIENHDLPRSINMIAAGDERAAGALAVSYMMLRGTPFIYQGQEIGMTNFPFTDISQARTTDMLFGYEAAIAEGLTEAAALEKVANDSRDNSRTPMQWTAGKNSGFTDGTPWMAVNPNADRINVAAKPQLTELYRQLIELRHNEIAISDGNIEFIAPDDPDIFAYKRDNFLIITNLSDKPATLQLTDIAGYRQVLGSSERQLAETLTLSAWDYLVYKK